jgi:hypothetical protein
MTREQIFEALDVAKDNGYDMSTASSYEAAVDMLDCNSDAVNTPFEFLQETIAEWQKDQKK